MISIEHISKEFNKGKVKAVSDVSFEIRDREIFGLLGPNGAGKTTTMRMISTLSTPNSGKILFNGVSAEKDKEDIKRKICFLTNEIRLDSELTPNESAFFYGSLYDMSKQEINERKNKLFDYFGISDYADRKYGNFSTGMKQKTSIAICLLHNPDIIIFDEPTNGLDVLTQRLIENFILDACKKEGKCVIISTHLLDVVERLCDRVGVIVDGKSVFCGTCQEMIQTEEKKNLSDAFVSLYEKNHTDCENAK